MSENLDRWRDLADELGLPPEPTPQPPTGRRTASPAPPPVIEEVVEPPGPLAAPVAESPPPYVEREAPPREEAIELSAITSLDPPTLDPMPDVAEDREEIFEDPRATADTERPRGRGGRRGQRGRRGRGDRSDGPPPAHASEPEAAGEVQPVSEEPAREESPRDERPHRGRGRRGPERRPEPEPLPDVEEDITDVEPEMEPAFAAAEEEDDGPEDNLADLNVPAWPDLIASLYRPDR